MVVVVVAGGAAVGVGAAVLEGVSTGAGIPGVVGAAGAAVALLLPPPKEKPVVVVAVGVAAAGAGVVPVVPVVPAVAKENPPSFG